MAAERQTRPGSRRGRPAVDWEQAFAHYAALPATERTYAAVAAAFGLSVRTVERHGREEGWQQRLNGIKAEVAATTNATIRESRVEHGMKIIRLIEASYIAYAENLRQGKMRMVPADLEKLDRLFGQLTAELGAAAPEAPAPLAATPPSPEHVVEVIAALAESGALNALGLQQIPTDATEGQDT